jgi:mRNA interferase RelE/StbE
MVYKIEIAEKLEKRMHKIPKKDRERLFERIDSLAHDPRPDDCKKLRGNRNPPLYRIRSGNYRIVYVIQDKLLIILIVDVDHRKDIYG